MGVAEPWTRRPHYLRPNTDAFRIVAESYGDDNPLWGDPEYATKSVWGGPLAPPPLVGGDSLIGEDEVTAVADDKRDLMKGDPLRGVHAFYSARRRGSGGRRCGPIVGCGDATPWWRCWTSRRSSRVGRCTSGRRTCSATTRARCLSGQYRLMIRTERKKAREKKKYDAIEPAHWTEDQIAELDAEYAAYTRRGAEPRFWEDVDEGDTVGPMVKGPMSGHRHGVLARRDGHGPLRRQTARVGCREPQTDPAVLPSRRPGCARRDATGALGPANGPATRGTRPRTTTAGCARRG